MRVGLLLLARRKRVGLETRIGYISPMNNAGIWHGAGVKSGFIETYSKKKTKRFWKPNTFSRMLYSELLDETIETSVTNKALRMIDYAGGFDHYILRTRDQQLCSNFAIELKRRMETVQRMLKHTNMSLEEIKKEIEPRRHSKHIYIHPEYTNRFYFDRRSLTKHVIYC